MADYCGGEYCCPTTERATCGNCGESIERYPLRKDNEWRHLRHNKPECPPPLPKAPGTMAQPGPAPERGKHLR